eukprot:TRINITY_DN93760_c0_g1_i1.p1 TRINITY_DN93760_c0_g1~~TRINITY_DN93760_c0_g1_i1.p1  ORF type:complete len:254 (-),score=27.71 TRINITY_DN93760_c0_g1_i1:11-772(-)
MFCCCAEEGPGEMVEISAGAPTYSGKEGVLLADNGSVSTSADNITPFEIEEDQQEAGETVAVEEAVEEPEGVNQEAIDASLMTDLEDSHWAADTIPVGRIKFGLFCWKADLGMMNSSVSVKDCKLKMLASSKDTAVPTPLLLDLAIVDGHVTEITWIDGSVWKRDPIHFLWDTSWEQKGTKIDVGEIKDGYVKWNAQFNINESPLSSKGPGKIAMKVKAADSPNTKIYPGKMITVNGVVKEIRWSDGDVWIRK